MVILAGLMDTFPWNLPLYFTALALGLGHSRLRTVSVGNYTRDSSWHCGYTPYHGAPALYSLVVSSLRVPPAQIRLHYCCELPQLIFLLLKDRCLFLRISYAVFKR